MLRRPSENFEFRSHPYNHNSTCDITQNNLRPRASVVRLVKLRNGVKTLAGNCIPNWKIHTELYYRIQFNNYCTVEETALLFSETFEGLTSTASRKYWPMFTPPFKFSMYFLQLQYPLSDVNSLMLVRSDYVVGNTINTKKLFTALRPRSAGDKMSKTYCCLQNRDWDTIV